MQNEKIKVSIIIAVYKDYEALRVILEALEKQTYKNFEVVIAEDNDSEDVKKLINSFQTLEISHFSQEDDGNRKMKIQNEAIRQSNGDYLIMIDGDCLPYTTFIQRHVEQSMPKRVLCGRRVNTGPRIAQKIKDNEIDFTDIERHPFRYYATLKKDGATHLDSLFSFNPTGVFYSLINAIRNRKNVRILGCNVSFYKDDMYAINGYDEFYGPSAIGHDTDLTWRFSASGCELVDTKFSTNMLHLYHPVRPYKGPNTTSPYKLRLAKLKDQGKFFCEQGLVQG